MGSVEPIIVGAERSIGVSLVARYIVLAFVAVLVAFADFDIKQAMTSGTRKGHMRCLAHDI